MSLCIIDIKTVKYAGKGLIFMKHLKKYCYHMAEVICFNHIFYLKEVSSSNPRKSAKEISDSFVILKYNR